MTTTGTGRAFAVCAVAEFHYEMPIDPLKTIPASDEIQHSAAAFLSGITVSEARFSFLLYAFCRSASFRFRIRLGHQSGYVAYQAQTIPAEPAMRSLGVSEGGIEGCGSIGKTASAHDPHARECLRLAAVRGSVQVWPRKAGAPLANIALHVIKPCCVRTPRCDRTRSELFDPQVLPLRRWIEP